VHGDVVVKGEDGEGSGRPRLSFEMYGAAVASVSAFFQALADVVVGDDGSLFLEVEDFRRCGPRGSGC